AHSFLQRADDILGEAHNPAVGDLRLETKDMRDGGRNQNDRWGRERNDRRLVRHFTAAALDEKNLKQIAVPVRADCPIMHRRARCDRLDVNKIKCLIVRRIAVEMKQRQRGRGRHHRSMTQAARRVKRAGTDVRKEKPRLAAGLKRNLGNDLAVLTAAHAGLLLSAALLLLAGLLLPAALLLLTGLLLPAALLSALLSALLLLAGLLIGILILLIHH